MATQPLLTVPPFANQPRGVDADGLPAHARALATQFVPRNWEHPENLDRAAARLRDELVSAGGEVEYQSYDVEGKQYRNVITRFGPATNEQVVVGAHYDAAEALPGADDNASAVAGLIELSHPAGDTPERLDYEPMSMVVRGVYAEVLDFFRRWPAALISGSMTLACNSHRVHG